MNQEPAFEFSGEGGLFAGGVEYEATFSLAVTPYGEIRGEASVPLQRESAGELLRLVNSNEVAVSFLGLRGDTEEGNSVSSDHIFVTSTKIIGGEDGSVLHVEFEAIRIDVFWDGASSNRPTPETVQYLIPGALGFSADEFPSPYGKVIYEAPSSVDEDTPSFGSLVLQCVPDTVREEQEAFVHRILEILSFAQGTELRWIVRKEFVGGALRAMRIKPSSWPLQPGFPVFSHLNLSPVLELATTVYTAEVREKSGLRAAMTWLLMRPRYREAEFLMGMTALEHLVSRSAETTGGSRIPRKEFSESVKPALFEALTTVEGLNQDDRDFFEGKMAGLNNLPFGDRLLAMLKGEGVPIADIKGPIADLAPIRNRIVHTGEPPRRAQGEGSLIFPLTVLRELIVRIVLHRLGFIGHYFCRLREVKWRLFPPEE